MTVLVRTSHRIYKRYQSLVEAAIASMGLAFLMGIVLATIPVYPPNWAPVLITIVALIGIRWPLLAYTVASLAVLYPIYTLSLYLAVLFLAIAVLLHRPASHYLGATVLILAIPLLVKYHLHWAVPVLAGLWWGSINGFWISSLAGLWGKLLGGMAGLDIDWLAMIGQSPTLAGLIQRYNGLSSLETLTKLIQPVAPDTTLLLFHLLQIATWGMVAGLVGFLAQQKWLYHHYPWSTLAASTLGIIALGAGHLFLSVWLRQANPALINLQPLLITAIVGLMVSSTLEVIRQSLELPVAPKIHKRVISVPVKSSETQPEVSATSTTNQGQTKPTPVPLPDLPEWEPPEEDNNDLILLELD